MNPDWSIRRSSLQALNEYIGDGVNFVGEGWYARGDSFALVKLDDPKTPENSMWNLYVWNDSDPRPELRRIIDFPYTVH